LINILRIFIILKGKEFMRAILQCCEECVLKIDNKIISIIDRGLLVYIGIKQDDKIEDINYICEKVLNLRVFYNDDGVMNLSVLDKEYSLMLVSQFTLYGSTVKGRRPSYHEAMKTDKAEDFFYNIIETFKSKYLKDKIKSGIFGSDMNITYTNLGPRTFLIDSSKVF